MYHSNSSTKALKQLSLQIPRKNNTTISNTRQKSKDYDDNSLSCPLFYLSISNPCKDIIHIGANAEEEYYHVELISEDNDVEYGIQAYGEEAKELYKEINGFTFAAATSASKYVYKEVKELPENDNRYQEEEEEEQEKLKLVKKAITCITNCCFDNGYVLIFKKLRNICVSKRKIMFS